MNISDKIYATMGETLTLCLFYEPQTFSDAITPQACHPTGRIQP
jgi:hypothetical protein